MSRYDCSVVACSSDKTQTPAEHSTNLTNRNFICRTLRQTRLRINSSSANWFHVVVEYVRCFRRNTLSVELILLCFPFRWRSLIERWIIGYEQTITNMYVAVTTLFPFSFGNGAANTEVYKL